MEYSLSISSVAEDDLRKAFLWYEDKELELARDFVTQTDHIISAIHQNPLHSQIKYKNLRVRYLDRFPYGFHYQVSGSQILLIAVFHTAMYPEKWGKR